MSSIQKTPSLLHKRRVSFLRYRVDGAKPIFGELHLDKLRERAIGKQRIANARGVESGWTAGDHILDTRFDWEKNAVNDCLHFSLRVDTNPLPADLLRAYTAMDLAALCKDNPSGFPSARQKREAKESARDRLEDEAKDGRFLKRKCYPVLWDATTNDMLFGATSQTAVDIFQGLFEATFGVKIALVNAEASIDVPEAKLSSFVPGTTPEEAAWIPIGNGFLGNELLLWLWYRLSYDSDTLTLPDKSDLTVMFANTLQLECPRGVTGREAFRSDNPTRLPEAFRAIRAGKLPRRAGLIMVRHDQMYELVLTAESLAVSGCKLPNIEADSERAGLEERVTQIRHLLETLDLLYQRFARTRECGDWDKELSLMQKWIAREELQQAKAG